MWKHVQLRPNMYTKHVQQTCTSNMYTKFENMYIKHVHNLHQTCTPNMYIIEQTCTQISTLISDLFNLSNHFCFFWKFWKCERFLCLASFSWFLSSLSEQPFEDGVSPDASLRNAYWFANNTFILTFQNRAVVLAKPSPAGGAARHQKGSSKSTLPDQIG